MVLRASLLTFLLKTEKLLDFMEEHAISLMRLEYTPIVPIKEGITMNMDLPRAVGPWGGNKGKSWDDGLLGGIQQIDVHVGNGMVHAIQCRYHRGDGNLLLSNRHGGGGASTVYKVRNGSK
ncbi:hypothetical protein Ddye_027724 [Dipteronia dyeriana]|uniref:Jacalin-type lectin domain-containing protein n=1 Tax=Dipteronia dyeriana TaxID=168575 RepID=A0AAD9WQG1_9ROSI|nr:hypothetical protein Ddye_027724 [Dipteronia dyeriana]